MEVSEPVIVTVDDDPGVSRAVARDLRRRYGQDYRIVRAESGPQALAALREMKLRGDPVAVLLADYRMPVMSGLEFLEQAMDLFPHARRALLTAYADTDAAIQAINVVDLDHYLLKPWDPPEEKLYPVLDALLELWLATGDQAITETQVVGHRWSARSFEVRDFLARNSVPYRWLTVEQPEGRRLLEAAGLDATSIPLVVTPAGDALVDPGVEELAARVGLSTTPATDFYDTVIGDGGEIAAHTVVLATGVAYHKLNVPGADRLTGLGVFYGSAATEAPACAGEDVHVVGGANSAGQAAMFLSRHARRVTLLVRADGLERSMSSYLIRQIRDTPNIQVRPHTQVVEAAGGEHLERIRLCDTRAGTVEEVPASYLFVFIGAAPCTDWLDGVIQCDSKGFLLTGPDLLVGGKRPTGWTLDRDPYYLEGSVPGIFAAGDARANSVKRVASAVGEGAMAIQLVHRYLEAQ